MAICKHSTSKNANYSDVLEYMVYEHIEDLETGHYEPVRDENNELIKRKNCEVIYMTSTGELSDPERWARDCYETNRRFRQNLKDNERKNHMYVLSFSPEDSKKLNLVKLRKIAKKFAKNFKGYQCLIAIHCDKEHYHIHFTINSCRDEEREKEEYMAVDKNGNIKKCEYAAGNKHDDGPKLRRWLNDRALEIAKEYGLDDKDMNKACDDNRNKRVDKREKMRADLLRIAVRSKDMDDFKEHLIQEGIELRVRGNTISVRREDEKRATRLPKLNLNTADLINAIGKQLDKQHSSLDKQIKQYEAKRDSQNQKNNKENIQSKDDVERF